MLTVCSCTPWYEKYGIDDKNALSLPLATPNLIQALDDPDPNVRKTAIKYISYRAESVQAAKSRLVEIHRNDPHPRVRKEAQKALTVLDKQTVITEVYNCGCNGFSVNLNGKETFFPVNFKAQYFPKDFRPVNGDKIKLDYYQYNNRNIVLSISAVDLIKNRFVTEESVMGTIGSFNSFRVSMSMEKKYPLILQNNQQIIINLGADPTYYIYNPDNLPYYDLSISTGDKLQVYIKDHVAGRGSCYVYSVKKVEYVN